MRAMILSAVLLVAASMPAFAGDEVLASRFGNTTITKDAQGNERRVYYNADHTFTGKQGDASFSGTWKIDGGTICLTTSQAIPGLPNPICTPVEAHAVGDTWTAGPYTVSLVAGIQ
jgi:hypothetical protein